LDLSKNELRSEGLSAVSEALKSTSIKQLNIAGNMVTYNTQDHKDMSGVIKFTGDMKDMGSLSSLHLGGNNISEEQMQLFIDMDKFDVLCGVPVKELKADSITELDLSGKSLGVEGALVLSASLKANASGSLSKLDLSKNDLRSEGLSAVSEALKSTSIKQLNIAQNGLAYNQPIKKDMSGVIKFADDMKDMGSLASLDISNNSIGSAQEAIIKQICAGRSIKCAL
jgi:hypothetical protein